MSRMKNYSSILSHEDGIVVVENSHVFNNAQVEGLFSC